MAIKKEKLIKEFFNKRIQKLGRDSFMSRIPEKNASGQVIKKFLEKNIQTKGVKILDAGCGEGRFSKYFIDKNANITSMDFSKEYIEICKNNFSKGIFVVGSVTNLPFKDNSFDYIFTVDVLQHVPNINKAISELYRVLKKGGKLYIIDKNRKGINSKYFLPERFLLDIKNIFRGTYKSFRERWFTPEKFKEKILEKFHNVKYTYLIEENKSFIFHKFEKMNLLVAWEAEK